MFSTEIVRWLQQFTFLTPVMKAFSFAGNEEFFLLLLPLFYLCLDRRAALKLGALLLIGDALNTILKIAFALPRPYWIDRSIVPLSTDTSFGLPSSHAQNAASIWGWLALCSRRSMAIIGALILIAGIGISRVFLGVHFPIDVIAGWTIGALVLWIFRVYEDRVFATFARQSLLRQIIWATGIAALLLGIWLLVSALRPAPTLTNPEMLEGFNPKAIVSRSGALWGLIVGAALASRHARFVLDGSLGQRVLRLVIALIGIGLIWKGVQVLAGDALWLRWMRYAFLTLWVTYFAPRVLITMKLLRAVNENRAATA